MQPTEDERLLAALSHASIVANVANLAGMIATGLIWTMQRERSRYVRAHALQALVYQGAVLLLSIMLVIFWSVCLGLSLLPAALRPDLYRASPPNSFWLALLGLLVPVGFGITATLYGLYGAYQVYRGRPFRYPLAGRLARDLSAAPGPQPPAARSLATPPAQAAPLSDAAAPDATPAAPVPAVEAPHLPPPAAPAQPPTKRRGRRSPTDEES
ncbi:MAG: DUF4870 domain-containing protein [Kouleothrix sp.]|nr:DUF4870 domain-containing protein [Kouleothrix sp.]